MTNSHNIKSVTGCLDCPCDEIQSDSLKEIHYILHANQGYLFFFFNNQATNIEMENSWLRAET